MKSYSEWVTTYFLQEGSSRGNYVSIDAPHMKNYELSKNGINVPSDKAHATIMYSSTTDLQDDEVNHVIDQYRNRDIICHPIGIDQFDDGDAAVCAIVLKIESPELQEIHDKLREIGLKHTYDFSPHITLSYKVPMEEADEVIQKANAIDFPPIVLSGFNVQPVDKNWISKIKS